MGNCMMRQRVSLADRTMEQERQEGQVQLRGMVLHPNQVDWSAVIAKANELHTKEQLWLRKQNKRQRQRFLKQQRRALQQRRQYDAIGSFSVNMLTYRTRMEDDSDVNHNEYKRQHSPKSHKTATSTLLDETQSNGSSFKSLVMTKSHEDGMEPIDEQCSI